MKNTTKLTFFLLLMLAFTAGLRAQDKYEFAQIAYNMNWTAKNYAIYTSITGVYQVYEEGRLADGKINNNFIPVNKVLNEVSERGWEVYSTAFGSGQDGVYSMYYLRRKKT